MGGRGHSRSVTRAVAAAAILAVAALSACGSSTSAASSPPSQLYVSLGDSYAAGYQPTGPHSGSTTRNGFAYQVVGLAKAKGVDLSLVNFGCGGATTISLVAEKGCHQLGPGGVRYPKTSQLDAAIGYLRAHRGAVRLITISIGGNDVTACAKAADAITCVTKAIAGIRANLAPALTRLRAAAGPKASIVGTTYPDVILGAYLVPATQSLAKLSVVAFQNLLNPALSELYRGVGGTLVDVTQQTGAYTPLDQTTTLAPYGTIPVAVAKVCQLTYFCKYQDIHPTTAGYRIIAQMVADQLLRSG